MTGRFFEVTPEKEVVWEFTNPFYFKDKMPQLGWNNLVFRAYRYSPDFAGLEGKTLNPDRFELTLREKPFWKEEAEEQRRRHLGY